MPTPCLNDLGSHQVDSINHHVQYSFMHILVMSCSVVIGDSHDVRNFNYMALSMYLGGVHTFVTPAEKTHNQPSVLARGLCVFE